MQRDDLHHSLEALKRELASLDSVDTAARERLQGLIDQVEHELETAEQPGSEGLLERVSDAIEEFEVEHPRATAILNDIMMTLSNMGI